MKENSKILIWGTGNVARNVLANGIEGEIIGFIESKKTKSDFMGKRVYTPGEIPAEYDYIIIASSYTAEIYQKCKERNINIGKVIFLSTVKDQKGFTDVAIIKKILGTKNFANFCDEFGLWGDSFFMDDMEKYSALNIRNHFNINKGYLLSLIHI